MSQRQYRLDFRKEDSIYIFDRIRNSTSASLVGVGSIGKSNLIAHLLNPLVHHHYLGAEEATSLSLIRIDANMLVPLSSHAESDDAMRAWSGYELLMHRMYLSYHPFHLLDNEEKEQFYQLYQALQDGRNPLYASMGLRYLELALTLFVRKGQKIVFLFDEFEHILETLPIKFFLTLRGLRDTYKSQLSFLTFSRSPLPVLVDRMGLDAIEIEPFVELFNDYVRYVGPYNEKDAQEMIATLSERSKVQVSESTITTLLQVTGRFAGLLRASWKVLESLPSSVLMPPPVTLASFLIQRKAIQLECQSLWDSLNSSEQMILRTVARLQPAVVMTETEDAVNMLVQKRLLRVNAAKTELQIEPAIFRAYLTEQGTDAP